MIPDILLSLVGITAFIGIVVVGMLLSLMSKILDLQADIRELMKRGEDDGK